MLPFLPEVYCILTVHDRFGLFDFLFIHQWTICFHITKWLSCAPFHTESLPDKWLSDAYQAVCVRAGKRCQQHRQAALCVADCSASLSARSSHRSCPMEKSENHSAIMHVHAWLGFLAKLFIHRFMHQRRMNPEDLTSRLAFYTHKPIKEADYISPVSVPLVILELRVIQHWKLLVGK